MKLARAFAVGIATIAVLSTVSALTMPVAARRAPVVLIVTWLVLLGLNAAAYELGDRVRRRFGLVTYALVQGTILFAIAVSHPPAPLVILLYVVAIAEMVTLAGAAWGSVRITSGAVVLLVLASLITSDLYQAAANGAVLAVAGLVAQAIAGLLRGAVPPAPRAAPARVPNGAPALTAREAEVLRELVSGTRNGDIADRLGISERTVKAHLGSVYQKLGVDSRSAAVAVALRLNLV